MKCVDTPKTDHWKPILSGDKNLNKYMDIYVIVKSPIW